MPKVRRIFSLLCRFGFGFFIGLTTLVGTAVAMMVFTVLHHIDYGPLIAIVLGCSMFWYFVHAYPVGLQIRLW